MFWFLSTLKFLWENASCIENDFYNLVYLLSNPSNTDFKKVYVVNYYFYIIYYLLFLILCYSIFKIKTSI